MLYIHIHEYPIYSIRYSYIHISIYNIDIHVTSGHIFSGKYGHTCTKPHLNPVLQAVRTQLESHFLTWNKTAQKTKPRCTAARLTLAQENKI